jgi:hypothetical protein
MFQRSSIPTHQRLNPWPNGSNARTGSPPGAMECPASMEPYAVFALQIESKGFDPLEFPISGTTAKKRCASDPLCGAGSTARRKPSSDRAINVVFADGLFPLRMDPEFLRH